MPAKSHAAGAGCRRETQKVIPRPTLVRLTEYLIILEQCQALKKRSISSAELSELFCNSPSQVRQDIYQVPGTRRCGMGYSVAYLISAIRNVLGLERRTRVAVVGCGRIGLGLACNIPFDNYGMELSALFDIRDAIIGQPVTGTLCIESGANMEQIIGQRHITIAILTVPDKVAQAVTDELVAAGVTGILNYTHERLRVPPHVEVKYHQVVCSLMQLSYFAHNAPELPHD